MSEKAIRGVIGKRALEAFMKPTKLRGTASGPVKTYTLSEEELAHYRAMPPPPKENLAYSRAKMK